MTASDYTLIGRNSHGEKLYIKADLRYQGNHLWRETTAHTRTTERLELSIQGVQISKYGNLENDNCWRSCGQNLFELLDLVTLEDGWNVADVVKLHDIWQEWHLNTMNAACDHQRAEGSKEVCPETGYVYGTKWLMRPLPYEVFAFICERFEIEPPTPGSVA